VEGERVKIKLDRTVCDGFGACAQHAPELFSMDDWGYPSLVGSGEVTALQEAPVRRALLGCPAHAIVELGVRHPMPAGGEPGVARSAFAARDGRAEGDPAGTSSNAPW
jgi:ferredoxin